MPGKNITIYESRPNLGGALEALGNAEDGYLSTGARETEPYFQCIWELCSRIPSLEYPGKTVLDETVEFNKQYPMPDIEILSRICNVFSVPADYLLGRTNTSAVRGKMKTVCELTGLSDAAAEFLSELLKHQRYGILDKLNYLLEEFANDCDEDYDMQGQRNLEDTSSILNALFGYMEKYSHFENALDFVEIEDVACRQKAETVYRELLIRRIIDAVKVGTEEYKEQHKPWE